MARTAAERAKEYRDRKRDENVTVDCDARHENVTVPDCDAPSVAECQARAKQGKPPRTDDPAWPYTRHLTPAAFVRWCREHRPQWLTAARPGDAGHPDAPGICRTCGAETPTSAVVRCYTCVFEVAA